MNRQKHFRDSTKMTTASDAVDPQRIIEGVAGPWTRGEKRPEWLARAAKEIGLPVGVIRALWYRKRKRLIENEHLLLKRSAATLHERRERMVTLHDEIRQARSRVDADADSGDRERPGDVD